MNGWVVFSFMFMLGLEAVVILWLLTYIRVLLARDHDKTLIFENVVRQTLGTIHDNTVAIKHMADRVALLIGQENKSKGSAGGPSGLPIDQDVETRIAE